MNSFRRNAFTLIELLVVISIIALLVGILLPALGAARESARGIVCMSHQKNLSTAFVSYGTDNNAYWPGWSRATGNDPDNEMGAWIPNGWYADAGGNVLLDLTKGSLYPYTPDPGVFVCPSDPYYYYSSNLSYTISSHIYRQPNVAELASYNWPEKGNKAPAYYLVDPAIQVSVTTSTGIKVVRCPNSDKFKEPTNLIFIVDEGGPAPDAGLPGAFSQVGVNDGYFSNLFSDLPGGNGSAGGADKVKWYHSDGAGFGFADGHGEIRKRTDEAIYKYQSGWKSDTGRPFNYGRIWDPAAEAPEIQGQ